MILLQTSWISLFSVCMYYLWGALAPTFAFRRTHAIIKYYCDLFWVLNTVFFSALETQKTPWSLFLGPWNLFQIWGVMTRKSPFCSLPLSAPFWQSQVTSGHREVLYHGSSMFNWPERAWMATRVLARCMVSLSYHQHSTPSSGPS